MKRIIYFIIIAVISAPAFSAVKGGKFFNAEESLSEDKRVLSRINSGDEAFAEYEAQQVRFEAEIEKRKVLQSQKVNIMRDKNAESLDEDMQAETAKKAELEKRRAEIERKTRELEERKAIVREKKSKA
jgi:hypothetical protein